MIYYLENSELLDAGTVVSTASLSAISRALSRMSMAWSTSSSLIMRGGAITKLSYQAAM